MKKKLLITSIILISALIEIVTVFKWLSHCKDFQGLYHINLNLVMRELNGELSLDKNLPFVVIRLFHNKFIDTLFASLRFYFTLLDFILTKLLSLTAFAGVILSLWYFFENKSKKIFHWIVLVFVIALPFIDVFFPKVPFVLRVSLYALTFGGISLYGIGKFVKEQKYAVSVWGIVILISLLFLFFSYFDFPKYCIQFL